MNRRPVDEAGFTLVELIVSMVVSLILIVSLLQIFNTATASWQRGEAQSDAFREARGAMQLMARDLSAIIPASYAQSPAGAAATPPIVVPTLVLNRYSAYTSEGLAQQTSTDSTDQQINEEVYCLTDVPSPPAASAPATATSITGARELCAIGYFCQWLPDIQNNSKTATVAPSAYGLMRQYLNGDGTFLRLKEATLASVPTASSPLSFASLYTRAQVTLVPSATPMPDLAQSAQLAAYIFDLKFRIDSNYVVNDPKYDNGETSAPGDHSAPTCYYSDKQFLPPALPAYIEIRFKALSETIGRRLEGNTTITPADWVATSAQSLSTNSIYKNLILPHSEQFVLRVPLVNSAQPTPAAAATP